ncbi:flagellar motor switch protein FliG, partial [Aquitalea sp. S1-19]|nr:flagellar motor switch protein FliG [Aquitalea sp. S1-19]
AGSVQPADLIRNEHPQIIATILVHLEPDQSSGILASFPERMRNEVLIRTATLEGVQPQALRELNEVLDIDDRAIQTILREVQSDSLVIALKGTTPEMREKIFKNMSQRAAEMLRDDLESKGPVKLSEVEGEQKEILKIVRKLADEGQIVLASKGGDEGLVE